VKKITLRADEELIEQARLVARARHMSLSAAFREWLHQFTTQADNAQEVRSLMLRLSYVNAGRHFSREEMNSR
jgi:hypothetical protein